MTTMKNGLSMKYFIKVSHYAASTAITTLPRLQLNLLGRCEKRTGLTTNLRVSKGISDGYTTLSSYRTAPWWFCPL